MAKVKPKKPNTADPNASMVEISFDLGREAFHASVTEDGIACLACHVVAYIDGFNAELHDFAPGLPPLKPSAECRARLLHAIQEIVGEPEDRAQKGH